MKFTSQLRSCSNKCGRQFRCYRHITYSRGLLGNWKLCACSPHERPLADPLTEQNNIWLGFPFSLDSLTHALTRSLTGFATVRSFKALCDLRLCCSSHICCWCGLKVISFNYLGLASTAVSLRAVSKAGVFWLTALHLGCQQAFTKNVVCCCVIFWSAALILLVGLVWVGGGGLHRPLEMII